MLVVLLSAVAGGLLARRALAVFFTALIAAYLVVLVAKPTWPALAAIGPTPGEGGRFYGSTNLTTSIVVTVTLFAGAVFGLRGLVPVAALSLVTVGWSKAGADGGGLVVLAAGCAVLGGAACHRPADGEGGCARGRGGREPGPGSRGARCRHRWIEPRDAPRGRRTGCAAA